MENANTHIDQLKLDFVAYKQLGVPASPALQRFLDAGWTFHDICMYDNTHSALKLTVLLATDLHHLVTGHDSEPAAVLVLALSNYVDAVMSAFHQAEALHAHGHILAHDLLPSFITKSRELAKIALAKHALKRELEATS